MDGRDWHISIKRFQARLEFEEKAIISCFLFIDRNQIVHLEGSSVTASGAVHRPMALEGAGTFGPAVPTIITMVVTFRKVKG